MRRPAPLPASADEPDRVEPEPPVVRRPFGRRGAAASADAPAPAEEAVSDAETQPLDGVRASVPEDVKASAAEAAPDASAKGETDAAPLRSGDVWRAARARRKALRAEIRRFTQRSRRRRMITWGWIGAVVVVVLGSVIAAYSPLFAVQKITVAGAKSLDTAAVQQALADQIGSPLALIDASAVKSALTEFPLIESYALEARPPHELLVRIVERTPIGVLESDAGFTLVDAAGVELSTTPEQPAGQPVLDIAGDPDSAAFRSAGLVVRSLPADLRATVTKVTARSGDDVTFTTNAGLTVVWGSDKDSVEKAIVLVELIKAAPDARSFDVSSPRVPVVG